MNDEEEFTEGDGTEENPYIIDNSAKLVYFANCINNGIGNDDYYELRADIDLNGINWIPIGLSLTSKEYYSIYTSFNGHFNGNGYEISNCEITSSVFRASRLGYSFNVKTIGLFGYNTGVIENLGIVNFKIDVEWSYGETSRLKVGLISGTNEGIINNCYSIGVIKLNNDGIPSKSAAPGSIIVGGIVGLNDEGVVSNSYTKVYMNIKYDDERTFITAVGICLKGYIKNCLTIFICDMEFSSLNDVNQIIENFGTNDKENCYIHNNDNRQYRYTCTIEELNSKDFYTNMLKWNEEVWNLENIKFENFNYCEDNYPKLYKK